MDCKTRSSISKAGHKKSFLLRRCEGTLDPMWRTGREARRAFAWPVSRDTSSSSSSSPSLFTSRTRLHPPSMDGLIRIHRVKRGEQRTKNAHERKVMSSGLSVESLREKPICGVRTVEWTPEGTVRLIDQRILPQKFELKTYDTPSAVADAIRTMVVRGAPAIGAAGALGMVLAAKVAILAGDATKSSVAEALASAKRLLDGARPTAVNLEWATHRILKFAEEVMKYDIDLSRVFDLIKDEATTIIDEDVEVNVAMAKHGADVVPDNANILHHCNTGALATVDVGTALGVVYECHAREKNIHVWIDETRPRLQGARLTAWECMRAGVDCHLIVDSAAGHLMSLNKVDVVLYGADRVAKNGDVANKIGTYQVSVLAHENSIPVYAVVPTSTIDLSKNSGSDIPIEERGSEEVTNVVGKAVIAPEGMKVFNPAFDVTPSKYLTGIITEEGVCYPPYEKSLVEAKEAARQRRELRWQGTLSKISQQLSK